MAAYQISAKRRVLLLGIAVLLIASSQAQSPFARDDASAEQSNTVEIDRRPLIKVPVIDGVAKPVRVESELIQNESGDGNSAAGDGGVRFELDHEVPSVEELEKLYPNEGRNFLFRSRPFKSAGSDKQSQSEDSTYRKGSDVIKSLRGSSTSNTDSREEGVKGEGHTEEGDDPIVESGVVSVNTWDVKKGDAKMNEESTSKKQKKEREKVDHRDKEELASQMAEKLLDQYHAAAVAELETYKKEQQSKIGSVSEENKGEEEEKRKEDQTKVVEEQDGEIVVVHKLNKNYENFDKLANDDVQNGDESTVKLETGTGTGSRGDRTQNRVLAHHHHHHATNLQAPWQGLPQQNQQQQNQQQKILLQENSIIQDPSLKDVVDDKSPHILSVTQQDGSGIKNNGDGQVPVASEANKENEDEEAGVQGKEEEEVGNVFIPEDALEIGEDEKNTPVSLLPAPAPATSPVLVTPPVPTTSPEPAAQPVPASPVMPDALRTRGMIPSVQGAHHCTPQFCVNVSLSDDGYFATFHIERAAAETGWISLGIGYAMTMADLLIFWPNPTPQNGGGPRGAVLSRRTSHAYVEPTLVGRSSGNNPLGDSAAEASLYPPNEYVLHNSNPGGANTTIFPDASKFIVQFTRPVRTRNLDYKLTPGQEQDFCWAFSPKPISPDSVADPSAHITQHLSVGSFAMDVGASQPQLKDVLLKQKELDERLDAAENERKTKELEKNNRQLHNEEKKRAKAGGGGKHKAKNQAASSDGMALFGPIGAYPSLAQISCCLVAIALAVSVC
ncbi:hypothetical protein EDD21DRAFT_401881 [Dissophora ornata]|nr:hypothetical protein EDD21DRAFT_401881 [Dissophora ornata]